MLVLLVVVAWSAAMLALYKYLSRMRSAGTLWRRTVAIGVSVGLVRGGLASIGWYGVEHTGGPLQVPAYLVAMLAWPEAALWGRHRGLTPLNFYPLLVFALTVSSLAWFGGVALLVQVTHHRRGAGGGAHG